MSENMKEVEEQDAALVESEVTSVEVLFRAHAAFIASFLRRLGALESEVDDLVQEVFLVAHKKGGYRKGPAHPRSWLAAIAVHHMQNRRRSRARRREDPNALALELAECAGKNPAETLELRESLVRVQGALDTLDVDHRAAFILYELEDESCQTIAELLRVPIGTVYSRLHKARRRFLEAYESAPESPAAGLAALALVLGGV